MESAKIQYMKCPKLEKSKQQFIINDGKKRMITRYSKNEAGNKLKEYHIDANKHLNAIYCRCDTSCSYAYQVDKNCKKLVLKHLKNNFFYKLDIMSFFPSINHKILKEILISKDPTLSELEINDLIASCSMNPNGLDLGMIPSGTLANIYLSNFDIELKKKLDQI